MGSIASGFAAAFRDYVTDGVPASGAYDPEKSVIRALGPTIEASLGALSLGSVGVTKDTRAHLNADLAHAANTVALVYADGTDANNDLYVKVGASGSGSWTLTSILHDAIEGIAQPYVDAAEAAAATAATIVSGPNGTMKRWLSLVTAAGSSASSTVQAAMLVVEQQLRSSGLISKIVRLNLRCGNGAAAARIPFMARPGCGNTSDTGTLSSWAEANGLSGFLLSTGLTFEQAGLGAYNLCLGAYILNDAAGADLGYVLRASDSAWGFSPRYSSGINYGFALNSIYSMFGYEKADLTYAAGGSGNYPCLGTMQLVRSPAGAATIYRNGIALPVSVPADVDPGPLAQVLYVDTTKAAIGADWVAETLTSGEASMLHWIIHNFNVAIRPPVAAEGL